MTAEYRIIMADCENVILRELQDKQFKQRDIAQSYALAMASGEDIDWQRVNKAIIERWSKSGLTRVKEMAWSGRCWA